MLAFSFVPEPDKTNKLVHPAKTQISLDIHPVLSVFDVRMKFGSLANHKVHIEDFSNWADVQADQSSQGRTGHFVVFCHALAHLCRQNSVDGFLDN